MMKNIKIKFEDFIDNVDPKLVDKISYSIILFITGISIYLFISTLDIIKTPILETHSIALYTITVLITVFLFFFTMLGDKTNKPVCRPKIFLLTASILAILTYSLLAEIFNYTFTVIIDILLEVAEVPSFLILTNVRIFTVFVPLLIVVLVFNKSLTIPFNKLYEKELLEYQVDLFTRNVYKIDDTKVAIKLCEDIETGKPIIVPEEITFRHKLIDGSSGSGKTALNIRPDLTQLFYKKALFKENLKSLTFKALEMGLCELNINATNKYLNDNFSMDFITIKDERKDEFFNLFKDYIIGIRNSGRRLFEKKYKFLSKDDIKIEVPIIIHSDIKKIVIKFNLYENGLISDTISVDFKKNIVKNIENSICDIKIIKKPYSEKVINEDGEEEIRYIQKEIGDSESNRKIYSEYLDITITPKLANYQDYSFEIVIDESSNGKIIYRDLGVTVIAPDGGLAKDAVEIAAENNIKVYKIDPKKEEIDKGNIAKFNPLLVGSPEKAGDIVSSILVAMEQNSGKDSNPYYTNASIRAVRNVIILLKVMYPIIHNGKNPILTDALEMLNNFSLVEPYVEKMKQDSYLRIRWKSVIDYFETSFYAQPYDEEGKRPLKNTHIGSKTKKTEEAIGGIINQLDNFLGREEIRYIFCDRENSLNLSEVLENGDCLAISTRQSELGDVLGKAFALMIILSIQNAVLGRYSEDENPEIPYHLYIDEFPFYVNDQTKVFFTFARKYKCSMTVAIQNLSQLEEVSDIFRQVIFTNCTTKIVLPGSNVEDREYFAKAFGIVEEFETTTSINSNPVITENAKYSEAMRGQLKEKNKVSEQELAELKFKRCYYTTVDKKGNTITGKGYLDFIKLTENNTVKANYYNFESYIDKEKITDTKEYSKIKSNTDRPSDFSEEFDINNLIDVLSNDLNLKEAIEEDASSKTEISNINTDRENSEEVLNESNYIDTNIPDVVEGIEEVIDYKEEETHINNIDFNNLNIDFDTENINVISLPTEE